MTILRLTALPLATLVLAPWISAANAPPRAGDPIIVVAPPWRDAAAVTKAAGGRVIGPRPAPLAVLAEPPAGGDPGDFRARLRAAGALLVFDATRLAAICGR